MRKEKQMNKQRRKELKRAMDLLTEAHSIIEDVKEAEWAAYDNMSEGQKTSERGERIVEDADRLDGISSEIEYQTSELEDVING